MYLNGVKVMSVVSTDGTATITDESTVKVTLIDGTTQEGVRKSFTFKEGEYALYTGTNFFEALGDDVIEEIIASDDVRIKRIEKMFEAVIFAGKEIYCGHDKAREAFDELVTNETVPSFTGDLLAKIEKAEIL